MLKIGWIGLGYMGVPMARNLLKDGVPLYVFNRTKEKAQALIDAGAILCSSPKEVAEHSDIVFTMLSDADAVKCVLEGDNGILSGMRPGKIVVDMSTVSPADSNLFAQMAAMKEVHFLDAPVSGSVKPAQDGTLVILVGGKSEILENCRPYFEKLGKALIRFGDTGAGSFAKLVINSLLAITIQGVSEALVLAEKGGLQREQVLHMISESAVGTPLVQGKQELFMTEDFPAAFMLKLMSKDLGLASHLLEESNLKLPLIATAETTYASAKQNGKGDLDVAGIFKELQEMNIR